MSKQAESTSTFTENNIEEESETDDTPSLDIYRSMRLEMNKGKGKRIHFQFSLDEVNLYHSKLKTKHQTEPIPISRGSETHYSHGAEFYLIPNEDFTNFSLKTDDTEIMVCTFEKKKKEPKLIKVIWKENPDEPQVFINQEAEKTDAGIYVLDFDGRYAEPSIKNCMLVHEEDHELAAMFRRIDSWEMNVDAKHELSDLMLFALILCLNVCPF
ncbi:hypothetical protein M9Y10_016861 [Tritrichomonas musculus]|uniref:Tubby C-terminal domain-containing protein n=1 Tax=Tritrichomonas musculus TaxID=1915356 RepID=A0ABR2HXR5_9EUKA